MNTQKTGDTLGYGVVIHDGDGWYSVMSSGVEPLSRSVAREYAKDARIRHPNCKGRMVRIVLDK